MADFRTIKGLYIKHVSSDPSNLVEGDIWYNTTTQTLKTAPLIAAWASGTNMPVATNAAAGAGTSTAAFLTSGNTPAGSRVVTTFEYDGSSWGSGGDINTGRDNLSAACNSSIPAGLVFGGSTPSVTGATEEYNGTAWTESGDLNTARNSWIGGVGTQTAALAAGGGPYYKNESEEYDGSTWTEGNNLNVSRQGLGQGGTQTAGLVFGGEIPGSPSASTSTEEYDGTSWTAGEAMGAGRYRLQGCGTQTSAIAFLGIINPPASDSTVAQTYDGTDWATTSSLATARQQAAGFGASGLSAVAAGGYVSASDANSLLTEEFSATVTLKTVTDS